MGGIIPQVNEDSLHGVRNIPHLCHPAKMHHQPPKNVVKLIRFVYLFQVGQSAEHGLRSQKVN